MKTINDIIAIAKTKKSYTINLSRSFSNEQQENAKKLIPAIIEQCKKWDGKDSEEDSFNPFDKLARALGRARM